MELRNLLKNPNFHDSNYRILDSSSENCMTVFMKREIHLEHKITELISSNALVISQIQCHPIIYP